MIVEENTVFTHLKETGDGPDAYFGFCAEIEGDAIKKLQFMLIVKSYLTHFNRLNSLVGRSASYTNILQGRSGLALHFSVAIDCPRIVGFLVQGHISHCQLPTLQFFDDRDR